MTIKVSNQSGVDAYFCVNNKVYLIQKDAENVCIVNNDKRQTILVKRTVPIAPPPYKTVFWSEFLSGLAALFIKPWFYTLDISSSYSFSRNDQDVFDFTIIRNVNDKSLEFIYDAVSIASPDINTAGAYYKAENKDAILKTYKKARKTAHFWLYFIAVFLFSLIGIVVTGLPLIFINSIVNSSYAKAGLILIPILLACLIGIIIILPLHFLFKYQDKKFYQRMEHEEIFSRIASAKK